VVPFARERKDRKENAVITSNSPCAAKQTSARRTGSARTVGRALRARRTGSARMVGRVSPSAPSCAQRSPREVATAHAARSASPPYHNEIRALREAVRIRGWKSPWIQRCNRWSSEWKRWVETSSQPPKAEGCSAGTEPVDLWFFRKKGPPKSVPTVRCEPQAGPASILLKQSSLKRLERRRGGRQFSRGFGTCHGTGPKSRKACKYWPGTQSRLQGGKRTSLPAASRALVADPWPARHL